MIEAGWHPQPLPTTGGSWSFGFEAIPLLTPPRSSHWGGFFYRQMSGLTLWDKSRTVAESSTNHPMEGSYTMYAYMYNAGLLCEECGESKQVELKGTGAESSGESDVYPQGPYPDGGGECDTPQHCDNCDKFLENPLTSEGDDYVRESYFEAREGLKTKRIEPGASWSLGVTQQWANHYDYLDLPGRGKCCICTNEIQPIVAESWDRPWIMGHNAAPIAAGRCCIVCQALDVLPARIAPD